MKRKPIKTVSLKNLYSHWHKGQTQKDEQTRIKSLEWLSIHNQLFEEPQLKLLTPFLTHWNAFLMHFHQCCESSENSDCNPQRRKKEMFYHSQKYHQNYPLPSEMGSLFYSIYLEGSKSLFSSLCDQRYKVQFHSKQHNGVDQFAEHHKCWMISWLSSWHLHLQRVAVFYHLKQGGDFHQMILTILKHLLHSECHIFSVVHCPTWYEIWQLLRYHYFDCFDQQQTKYCLLLQYLIDQLIHIQNNSFSCDSSFCDQMLSLQIHYLDTCINKRHHPLKLLMQMYNA